MDRRHAEPLWAAYPPNWPACPACGRPALDGHLTCGEARCDEAGQRLVPKVVTLTEADVDELLRELDSLG